MIPTYVFPIFAAVLYGLNYAILGKILQTVSIPTFIFYSTAIGILFAATAVLFNYDSTDFTMPIVSPQTALLLFIAVGASWAGWLFTSFVTKDISPTYAAIGEIAYPIFVPIFAYLLFQEKQWDWPTIIGGALIFLGLFVMIFSKMRAA